MQSRLPLLLATLFFACAAPMALAQTNNDGFVVWDESIASAVSAGLPDEHKCGASPYAVYGPRCRARLNLSFDRPLLILTFLDRAALFVHKYHKLDYNQSLWDNAKLKFEVNLKNVYKQEARARMELRYRFPIWGPRKGLLAGFEAIDLPHPSFYEN
jgi:hypothetical protein